MLSSGGIGDSRLTPDYVSELCRVWRFYAHALAVNPSDRVAPEELENAELFNELRSQIPHLVCSTLREATTSLVAVGRFYVSHGFHSVTVKFLESVIPELTHPFHLGWSDGTTWMVCEHEVGLIEAATEVEFKSRSLGLVPSPPSPWPPRRPANQSPQEAEQHLYEIAEALSTLSGIAAIQDFAPQTMAAWTRAMREMHAAIGGWPRLHYRYEQSPQGSEHREPDFLFSVDGQPPTRFRDPLVALDDLLVQVHKIIQLLPDPFEFPAHFDTSLPHRLPVVIEDLRNIFGLTPADEAIEDLIASCVRELWEALPELGDYEFGSDSAGGGDAVVEQIPYVSKSSSLRLLGDINGTEPLFPLKNNVFLNLQAETPEELKEMAASAGESLRAMRPQPAATRESILSLPTPLMDQTRKVAEYILDHPFKSLSVIVDDTGVPLNTMKRHILKTLRKRGMENGGKGYHFPSLHQGT